MNAQFKGKAVLVTGAGHGIGRQIATDFAAEGTRVGVNDLSPERAAAVVKEITANGGQAVALPADIRYSDQVDRMMTEAFQTLGRLDILVNNAGIYPNSLVVNMTEDEWDRVWDTNVKGTFLVSQAAIRRMIAVSTGGKIINMSSGAELRARVGAAHYCASKAAISMFTKVLALEVAPHRINVNAVAPGLIEVPDWGLTQEYVDALVSMTPWGRIGLPRDVSHAVRFLASDEADFITGSVLLVDGGAAAGQNLPLSG